MYLFDKKRYGLKHVAPRTASPSERTKGGSMSKELVGKKIKIVSMKDEPSYCGRVGVVEYVDDIGQLHGTWGGLAVIPSEDRFEVLN